MFEDIRKNKLKSGFIVMLFIVFVTLIIYYICMAFDLGIASIIIALSFSLISTWSSYYFSDRIILSLNKARPATPEEEQKVINILDALVISAGMQYTPKLYIVEDAQPNAFATGRNPKHSIICVTIGLLSKLDYYELEGVIGHELAHIKNYDILLSSVVTVMVGLVVMLADMFTRIYFFGGSKKGNDKDSGTANTILMLLGLFCLLISPIFSKLMQLALSRRREYLADATSVEFTRNPQGLISALKKISNDSNELKTANESTASMFIINPFRKGSKTKRKDSLFSTHPSTESRIEALEKLK